MSEKRTIFVKTDLQRATIVDWANRVPIGWTVEFRPETRTDAQNRKMWPMIADMRRQVPKMLEYSSDDVKLIFMNALKSEVKFLPELDGSGMFPVGQRSSLLTKAQFAALIELMYKYGAENNVLWSEWEPSEYI